MSNIPLEFNFFKRPKWQISLPIHNHILQLAKPTLFLYAWSQKKVPLSWELRIPVKAAHGVPLTGREQEYRYKTSFYRICSMGKSTLLNKNWTWKMRGEHIIVYGNNIVVPLQHLPVLIFHFLYHCFFLKINITGISRTETGRMFSFSKYGL